MILSRLFVGVGEAAFSCIAPPMLDTYAPKKTSSCWFSTYFLAMPAGFALGFIYGGFIEKYINWHFAFLIEASCQLCIKRFNLNILKN